MSSPIEMSEDDESFEQFANSDECKKFDKQDVLEISSDETVAYEISSDEDIDLPAVEIQSKKSTAIRNLFTNTNANAKKSSKAQTTISKNSPKPGTSKPSIPFKPKVPGIEKMISGVNIHLPVQPYQSQTILMYKVITAINKGQNCLLESPTGSGKTLALLCSALAWQQQERNRLTQSQAQQYFSHYPELAKVDGVVDYFASSPRSTSKKMFEKNTFGEKSIYDKPPHNGSAANSSYPNRQDLRNESNVNHGEVAIHNHKKRKIEVGVGEMSDCSPTGRSPFHTPEKHMSIDDFNSPNEQESPQNISVPTIYYGARTHKQIAQVVKEFGRTAYCGDALMTVLSSREYSCIREFDKSQWGNKNDMCKGCIKTHVDKTTGESKTNCQFYDNRQALNHDELPPAFDLEDLVDAGERLIACPYYAARAMALSANIVFCPYNYLIDPNIRSSLSIDLRNNIVIIDEAHNIEDICRDAATYTISRDQVLAAIMEMENLADHKYTNQDNDNLTYLKKALMSWDHWFSNQIPLVANKPVNNSEAVHVWEVEHFVQTLNNHNIGQPQFGDFSAHAEVFVRRYNESPQSMYGINQVTCTLVDSLGRMLGNLFRESGKFKDDFKPIFIKTVQGNTDLSESRGWRNSQYRQSISSEAYSLRLLCLNSAIVFTGLKAANTVILASGTLTPLISLHSELQTEFPLKASPDHVIPHDRIWIGSLTTCPNGRPLECTSKGTDQTESQDALGETALWVCQVTPHGVLFFVPSYMLLNKLHKRWQETGLWKKLNDLKHVFMESRNVRDHNDIMEDYYKYVLTNKGALLFAVFRGKVSEGMDFKDHQARAVITVGIPYPNVFDMAVKEKMKYNDKYSKERSLLSSREWLRVQAYRALNQAVGRCVRHRNDWGAVLLVDARFKQPYYTEHLSKWVRNFLGNNHHSFESLVNSPNSLESFMQHMNISEAEGNN